MLFKKLDANYKLTTRKYINLEIGGHVILLFSDQFKRSKVELVQQNSFNII